MRDGVPNVVATMRKSGVQVMMITGDIIDNARAIAIDCGIMAVVNGFCVRTDGFNLLARLRTNPMFIAVAVGIVACTALMVSFGGSVLQLAPLNTQQWAAVIGLSLVIVPINLIYRVIEKMRK